jgi:hypothetical protein
MHDGSPTSIRLLTTTLRRGVPNAYDDLIFYACELPTSRSSPTHGAIRARRSVASILLDDTSIGARAFAGCA